MQDYTKLLLKTFTIMKAHKYTFIFELFLCVKGVRCMCMCIWVCMCMCMRLWLCMCVYVFECARVSMCYAFTSCMFPTYKIIFNIPERFINIICSTKDSTLMCLHSRPNSLSHINNQQYKNILNILQKHAHYYEHRELYMIPVKITKGFFDRVRF